MSTRATYSFEQDFSKKGLTIYIHWDGYPTGAAVYFWNMYKHLHVKGKLAEAFVKGNPMNTEFTKSHDWHGDTEYRYYMDQNGILTAQSIKPFTADNIQTIFSGHYAEFINQYDEILVKHNKEFERLHLLSDAAKAISYRSYLTQTEVKAKLLDTYISALNGGDSDKKNLSIWEAEYQRIKSLKK